MLSQFRNLLLLGLVAVGASACSLSSHQTHTLRFTFPQVEPKAAFNGGARARNSLSTFDCFGIQISGSGIAPDKRLDCPNAQGATGLLAGLVSRTGGEVDVDVPAGQARFIQVFALQSSIGCPTLDSLAALPEATRFQGLKTAFDVGEVTTDVLEDASVTVIAHYDPVNSKALFSGCGGAGGSFGGTLTRTLSSAQFLGGRANVLHIACGSLSGRPCMDAQVSINFFHSPAAGVSAPSGARFTVSLKGI